MGPLSRARRLLGGRSDKRAGNPIRDARDAVAALAASEGPVVAGPWLAEVGYELLYWIPFLRWAVEVEPSLAGRLTVASRGGVESWYAGIAADYVELYEAFTPAELEELREQGSAEASGVRKQMTESTVDRAILELVAPEASRTRVLHPSVMFQAFRQTLKRSTLRPQDFPFRYAPLEPPQLELDLPDEFVAVRFYYRASFPDTDENRSLVEATVGRLRERSEVVLLDPGERYDDHVDATVHADVVRPPELGRPSTNLAVQAAVIARARAFVGTYGGLAYLPPLLGVPALALYSDGSRFRPQHLELARRVFSGPAFGRFAALDTGELPLLADALGLGGRG